MVVVLSLDVRAKQYEDRTSELRAKGYPGRRLGPVQMTTDTAVRVTRMVVQDKGKHVRLLAGGGVADTSHSTTRQDPIH